IKGWVHPHQTAATTRDGYGTAARVPERTRGVRLVGCPGYAIGPREEYSARVNAGNIGRTGYRSVSRAVSASTGIGRRICRGIRRRKSRCVSRGPVVSWSVRRRVRGAVGRGIGKCVREGWINRQIPNDVKVGGRAKRRGAILAKHRGQVGLNGSGSRGRKHVFHVQVR